MTVRAGIIFPAIRAELGRWRGAAVTVGDGLESGKAERSTRLVQQCSLLAQPLNSAGEPRCIIARRETRISPRHRRGLASACMIDKSLAGCCLGQYHCPKLPAKLARRVQRRKADRPFAGYSDRPEPAYRTGSQGRRRGQGNDRERRECAGPQVSRPEHLERSQFGFARGNCAERKG